MGELISLSNERAKKKYELPIDWAAALGAALIAIASYATGVIGS